MNLKSLFVGLLLAWSGSALAEDEGPRLSWALAQTVTLPFGFNDPVFGAPPKYSFGVSPVTKIGKLRWMAEVGLNTPLAAVQPGGYLVFGPIRPVTKHFSLGERWSWRGTPRYGEAPGGLALGLALAGIFKTNFGAVSVPVGGSCNFDLKCGGAIGATVVIALGQSDS